MWWVSERSRHDGSPTDTQVDTKNRTPRQGAPTIVWRHEEDDALKEVALSRYRCANCILETKTKVGSTSTKVPDPRTNPNNDETPTTPKPPTHSFHLETPRPSTPSSCLVSTSSSILKLFIIRVGYMIVDIWLLVIVVVYYESMKRKLI